ncbi:MAG: helix-turn-helix domain-containing protein [Clostridia bacterium]|nr:helix-turn-helix domain-containing protein [Clostridia bacterium]
MTLKELRKSKGLTQAESAAFLGMPLRTYQNYENDEKKRTSFKYLYIFQKLEQYGFTDESHGVLSIETITQKCAEILPAYEVEYCYLFGSYAKSKAGEESDVDLLLSTKVSGIRFYDLVEALREGLKKKVDVLSYAQLAENPDLVNEILKDGIKIYG